MLSTQESGQFFFAQLSADGGDEDFELLYHQLKKYMMRSSDKAMGCVVELHPSHSLPNADARRKFGQLFNEGDLYVAIVTQNRMVMGVLTALNWISPQKSTRKAFSDTVEAKIWLNRVIAEAAERSAA